MVSVKINRKTEWSQRQPRNKKREDIFARAIKEAEKIKKSKKGQDISCGKVVCYINKN